VPQNLAEPAELERLRAYLEPASCEPLKGAVERLANKLQRRCRRSKRSWEFDLKKAR